MSTPVIALLALAVCAVLVMAHITSPLAVSSVASRLQVRLATLLVVVLAMLSTVGCAPATTNPACDGFHKGQIIRAPGSNLIGVVDYVNEYSGTMRVYFQGLPYGTTVWCSDVAALSSTPLER